MKLALAALLLPLWGNAFSLLHARLRGRSQAVLAWSGPLALLAACCGWDRLVRQRPTSWLWLHPQAAIRRQTLRAEIAWGAAAGAAMAVLPALWFRVPTLLSLLRPAQPSVTTEEVTEALQPGQAPSARSEAARTRPTVHADELGVPLRALLFRVFFVTPLLVALVEEVAFRGFLQGRLHRALPQRPSLAVALSSLSFTLWHVTVNLQTLRRTNVVQAGIASPFVAIMGGLGAVFAGGAIFGGLFHRTRSLTAPVMAHWLVDALMLLALYDWRAAAATCTVPVDVAQ